MLSDILRILEMVLYQYSKGFVFYFINAFNILFTHLQCTVLAMFI